MKCEIRDFDTHQELIMHDLRFFGGYDEMMFYYAVYTAGLTCFFKPEFVQVNVRRKTMTWQAYHIWQTLRRYGVDEEILMQLDGISEYKLYGKVEIKEI